MPNEDVFNRPAPDEAQIEAVREEILAAFSDENSPAPRQILGPSRGNKADEARAQKLFEGKNWRNLDAGFLKQNWVSFDHLSAEAFRYFLPALLLRSFDQNSKTPFSADWNLFPHFCRIQEFGRDPHFEDQISRLSAAQNAAVCSFLGLSAGSRDYYQYGGALALKWGWSANNPHHPAVVWSRDYFYALHNFQIPRAHTPEVQKLSETIQNAFAQTPYPGDEHLCRDRIDEEISEVALELRGLKWQNVHPFLLARQECALSF